MFNCEPNCRETQYSTQYEKQKQRKVRTKYLVAKNHLAFKLLHCFAHLIIYIYIYIHVHTCMYAYNMHRPQRCASFGSAYVYDAQL